jgi:nucleoside phosphorylase
MEGGGYMPKISASEARKAGVPETTLQTVLFDKDSWTMSKAVSWLKKHELIHSHHRETTNQHRYWQVPVVDGARFWSERDDKNGLTLVFQDYSSV